MNYEDDYLDLLLDTEQVKVETDVKAKFDFLSDLDEVDNEELAPTL